MSYDVRKTKFDREHIYIVESDQPKCVNTYGTLPCTASLTGDNKCYNTLGTCQDKANYSDTISSGSITVNADATAKTFTRTTGSYITDGFEVGQTVTWTGHASSGNNSSFIIAALTATVMTVTDADGMVTESGSGDEAVTTQNIVTYRFCEPRSPLPFGIDAIPSIESVSTSPAEIDISGGLGVRSGATIKFSDHPYSDILSDPYLADRTYSPQDVSTFWPKYRARHQGYQNTHHRILSGYIVNNEYDASNFITRHYILDKLTASKGGASISLKDPLKLAMPKKAQAPSVSSGSIANAGGINSTTTSITLDDASEYTAGEYICIDSEVILIDSIATNTLTVTRAQYNTVAKSHSEDALAQRCLIYDNSYLAGSGSLDYIIKDLLVNYAGISEAFIPTLEWRTEVSTYLSANLSRIIVKPTDINKLLKELAQAQPHYLWWDERSQTIKLTAIKSPPETADALDMDGNILADSFMTEDRPDMRVSTVIVNYGQFDPTKKVDEPTNYETAHIREDADSVVLYGSRAIKVINSPWIPTVQKAQAIKLSTLIGRRFSDIPRVVSFALDAKDSDGDTGIWTGDTRAINHREIVDFNGNPTDTIFQITSASEDKTRFNFKGIEFRYGDLIGTETESLDDIVYYPAVTENIDLYNDFFTAWGAPTSSTDAVFVIQATVGSTSTATPSVQFGSWTTFNSITLIVESGAHAVGAGGIGGSTLFGSGNGANGGTAIDIDSGLSAIGSITITANGIIGGGGGGGGGNEDAYSGSPGGGGAGYQPGGAGVGSNIDPLVTLISYDPESDGTTTSGGNGATYEYDAGSGPVFNYGGDGGDLGVNGESKAGAGGTAGKAINLNGNSITYSGDIRGTVS